MIPILKTNANEGHGETHMQQKFEITRKHATRNPIKKIATWTNKTWRETSDDGGTTNVES